MYYRVVILFLSHLFFSRREFFVFFVLAVLETIVDVAKQKKSQKTTSYLIIQANFKEHTNMLCRPQKNKDKNKNSKHNS
jgi:hypothetical protein